MSDPAETGAPVFAVTYIEAGAAAAEAVAAALRRLGSQSKTAAGNLGLLVLRESGRPSRFAIVEEWRGRQTLDNAGQDMETLQDRLAGQLPAPFDRRPSSGFLVAAGPRPRSSGDPVHVLTHVDVPPPSKDACIRLLEALTVASRNETGARRFDVLQQDSRPNHFTLVEAWDDAEAQARHVMADHAVAFRRALTPMLGALYDERLYRAIA